MTKDAPINPLQNIEDIDWLIWWMSFGQYANIKRWEDIEFPKYDKISAEDLASD